ncbi:unnamed protein product [Didymodactylos carnosus]|uniref:Uncharacterized protein n=1 Tax=Didymodactylos carnosus TaxID=1234261 RepID=A0A815QA26_9BILA|nr:unnamed protein product [Didymodactylos carnosus]CAF4330915.1 unnamed protein product [Didymodactylos carnosus]
MGSSDSGAAAPRSWLRSWSGAVDENHRSWNLNNGILALKDQRESAIILSSIKRNQRNIIKQLHLEIQRRIVRDLRFGRKNSRYSKRRVLITESEFELIKSYGVGGHKYKENDSLTSLLKLHLNLRMAKDVECECKYLKYLFRRPPAKTYETISNETFDLPTEIKLNIKFKRIEHILTPDGVRQY